MTNQTTSILSTRGSMTAKEIASEISLSESRVRELLKAAVEAGEVTRRKEGKVFLFEAVQPEPKKEAPRKEADPDLIGDKPKKPRSNFLGHPEASKNKNPQSTINAKRAAIKESGGSMVFNRKDRIWNIVSGNGWASDLTSSTLASMTLDQFKAEFKLS